MQQVCCLAGTLHPHNMSARRPLSLALLVSHRAWPLDWHAATTALPPAPRARNKEAYNQSHDAGSGQGSDMVRTLATACCCCEAFLESSLRERAVAALSLIPRGPI
jgi:hypothetical protein